MARRLTHSLTCAYPGCHARSRDNVPGFRFYRLPSTDPARTLQWLVNSGLPEMAEAPAEQLNRLSICNRHFPPEAILPSGRLNRDALPIVYNAQLREEHAPPVPAAQNAWRLQKRRLLQKIRKQNDEIAVLKNQNTVLKRAVRSGKKSIARYKKKIANGLLPDTSLAKAIYRKVQGFLYAFVTMQLFHKNYTHYNEEEKQVTMTMHYTSPSLYLKLRENYGFNLPSPSALKLWFGKIELWPGICPKLFGILKSKASCMDDSERQCVLIFDEIRLKKGFDYNERRQKVEGFEDLGSLGCSTAVANSALAFMVRGLVHNWKQPIGYFLASGNVPNTTLGQIIEQILTAVSETGLKARAVVCDQGTNNQSAVSARTSVDKPYFFHNGQKIYAIFDIPHIFKNIRNQLLQHNIRYDDGRVASWQDVRDLWDLEKNKGTRAAHKLSERHVNPTPFQRMTCKFALQVFSRRVSAALQTASVTNSVKSYTAMFTAEFFSLLNDSFDNLNSQIPNDANPNRCALSDQKPHVQENLESILVKSAGWRTITNRGEKVPPCFNGLRQSIRAILMLFEDLKSEGLKFLPTARVNQDPIENMFSMIRTRGGYNANPTPKEFRLNYQKLIVLNLLKPVRSANCIDDEDEALLQNNMVIVPDATGIYASARSNHDDEQDNDDDDSLVDVERIVINVDASHTTDKSLMACSVEFLAGYIAKKSIESTGCHLCVDELLESEPKLACERQILTYFRAYETKDNREFGHLCVATTKFSFIFALMNEVFDQGYAKIRGQYDIEDKLFPYIQAAVNHRYNGWFDDETCGQHRRQLAHNFMRVKIHKDVKWLGEKIRSQAMESTASRKPPQKLNNLRGA